MRNLAEPGARFRAAAPNHPGALLEEPQVFQAVGRIFCHGTKLPASLKISCITPVTPKYAQGAGETDTTTEDAWIPTADFNCCNSLLSCSISSTSKLSSGFSSVYDGELEYSTKPDCLTCKVEEISPFFYHEASHKTPPCYLSRHTTTTTTSNLRQSRWAEVSKFICL